MLPLAAHRMSFAAATAALFAVALYASNGVCMVFLSSPLKRDEVEFLHTAWLMHGGARPFADFFQHHSPLYFSLVSAFVDDTQSLGWVIELRLFSALLAGVSAILVAGLTDDGTGGRSTWLSWPAAFGALLFLLVAQHFPVFEIRPESVAIPAFLAAWLACEHVQKRPSLGAAITAALMAGTAIALTPRALWPVAGLLTTWLCYAVWRRERIQSGLALAVGLSTVATVLALLFTLASPRELYDWFYRFSRYSRPLSPLLNSVSASTLVWLVLPPPLLLLLFRARHTFPHPLFAPIIVLLAAVIGLNLEPRQFGQSLGFALVAVCVFYTRGMAMLLPHLPTRPKIHQPLLLVVITHTATVAWHLPSLPAPPVAAKGDSNDVALLLAMAPETGLVPSLRARAEFCARHTGERVMVEPTEFHPICLGDASYYWRGGEYLRAGTLVAADISAVRYAPLADALRFRPLLIGPALIHSAPAPEVEAIGRLLEQDYRRIGWAYLRHDGEE